MCILCRCYCVKTHFYFSKPNAQVSNQEIIFKGNPSHILKSSLLYSLPLYLSWASKVVSAFAGVSNFYQMQLLNHGRAERDSLLLCSWILYSEPAAWKQAALRTVITSREPADTNKGYLVAASSLRTDSCFTSYYSSSNWSQERWSYRDSLETLVSEIST